MNATNKEDNMSDRQIMMGIIEKVFIKFKNTLELGDKNFNKKDAEIISGGLQTIVKPILDKDEITIKDVKFELEKKYDSAQVSAFALILCTMTNQPLTAMGGKII